MRIAVALCMCLGLVQPAFGQHEHHEGMAPKDIGTVDFTTSCNPAVKTQFNEAVALLHSFWFGESRAAFEGVLKTDASCAMAHWGIALTHWGNPFGGLRAAQVIANGKAAIASRFCAIGRKSPCSITRRMWSAGEAFSQITCVVSSSRANPVSSATMPPAAAITAAGCSRTMRSRQARS